MDIKIRKFYDIMEVENLSTNPPETMTKKSGDQNEINLLLIPFTKDLTPSQDGKYLVRTETIHGKGMTSIHYVSARVVKYQDKDKNDLYSIDVNNQKITHISKIPLS